MNCYLTQGLTIKQIDKIGWLSRNAHRVVNLRVLKFTNSNSGKLMAILRDGSVFHAPFISHRSMIAWLFHPQFEGMPFGVFGYQDDDLDLDWNIVRNGSSNWITAGGQEHWKLLTELMGK